MKRSDTPRLRADVRVRTIGGEAVVVVQSAAEVMVLNEVGTRVIELVDGSRTVGDIVELLLGEFNVGDEQLVADVSTFLDELRRAGALDQT